MLNFFVFVFVIFIDWCGVCVFVVLFVVVNVVLIVWMVIYECVVMFVVCVD